MLLRLLLRGFCLFFALNASLHAETLAVGGIGSADPLVRLLFKEFSKQVPDTTLNLIEPPMGSGSAVKALALNRLDIAVLGRALSPEEEKQVGMHFPLADTPLVMASKDGQRRNGFSIDELASAYDGRLQKWDSGLPIRLVLRASFESDTLILKSMSPAMEKSVTRAGQRPGMVIGDNELDTLALLNRTTGSLGPTSLGLLSTTGTRLSVFPINGVTPSGSTLRNGAYPWRKRLIVALARQPKPVAESFAEFLRSGKARVLLQRYDYLPAGQ